MFESASFGCCFSVLTTKELLATSSAAGSVVGRLVLRLLSVVVIGMRPCVAVQTHAYVAAPFIRLSHCNSV